MAQTKNDHRHGALVTFNNELTIIAGWETTKVEVFEDGSKKWTPFKIDSTPSEFIISRYFKPSKVDERLEKVSALVVTESGMDCLFIFGRSLYHEVV